ncbi:unnamed protein product [Blepharisma stoltei]|uniref:Uncharacterized protein n=1 Tax=Blepharisma stoltei TaxID=1481888 RepID=A0AAU9K782_9CILI|nr:unnamed protein product [Blepharisma stoltei]
MHPTSIIYANHFRQSSLDQLSCHPYQLLANAAFLLILKNIQRIARLYRDEEFYLNLKVQRKQPLEEDYKRNIANALAMSEIAESGIGWWRRCSTEFSLGKKLKS